MSGLGLAVSLGDSLYDGFGGGTSGGAADEPKDSALERCQEGNSYLNYRGFLPSRSRHWFHAVGFEEREIERRPKTSLLILAVKDWRLTLNWRLDCCDFRNVCVQF